MQPETEYINIKNINSNKKNVNYYDENPINSEDSLNLIDVFQVQGQPNTNNSIILKIGQMQELNNILIKQFDIPNFKCYMISKIYDDNSLRGTNTELNCTFQMIKIMICKNNNEITPIASLQYNFNTFEHIRNKTPISKYLSTSANKILLNGFFSITLHFKEDNNNKYITLENYKIFQNELSMMKVLTEWLLDYNVQEILKNIKI